MGVAHAGSPERGSKDNDRQEKEDAGDLEPEDSAHAAKGPEESPYALANAAPGLGCDLARGLPGGPTLHAVCLCLSRLRLRCARGGLSLSRNSLPCDSPGDSNSNAQGPPNVARFHTVYDGSSGSWRALREGRGSRLLSDGNGSKVEIPRRNPPFCVEPPLEVFMTSRLRELIQQLGEAIHESVIESEQIAGVVQDIRKHGFDVLLMLEATIGLNEVTAANNKKSESGESGSETSGETGSFTQNDLHFLKSLRISVEGDDEEGEISGKK